MGTTGSGRLDDYPGSANSGGGAKGEKGGSGGGGGGDDDDRCARSVHNVFLEEIERADYYQHEADVPPVGTDVILTEELIDGRLAVATVGGDQLVIGYLPSQYSYLHLCQEEGWTYSGEVVAALTQNMPVVKVTLHATR